MQGPELIHYSRFTQKGNGMKFMRYLYEDTKTLYDVFPRGARISSNLISF
jgi:long-chain acyl-CoA synthetase